LGGQADKESDPMKLYGYYRSSTSYRLRIALELKRLAYDYAPVNLLKGEQKSPEFLAINPFGSVPALEHEGKVKVQSMAILEWLDEAFPDSPLLPTDIEARYTARELAYAIATELHAPLNLPVLKFLREDYGKSPDEIARWYRHWLARTLEPLERRLDALGAGDFLFDRPGLFECVLLPQAYNARRFGYDLDAHAHIARIEHSCLALEPFQRAHPDNQPDNPERNT